jgi:hypothetical protein
MSKAAILATSSNNGEVGALYMDTSLGFSAKTFNLSFDISTLAAPATATAQGLYSLNGGTDKVGVLFGLRTYESTTSQWAVSFAIAPTSTSGGVFGLRDSTNSKLYSFGTYTNGQKYRISLVSDYITGTVNAYVNGVLGYTGFPMRTGAISGTPNTSELFIYFNGENGLSNQVAIDNINACMVPEPSAITLLSIAGLGLLLFARRRHRN